MKYVWETQKEHRGGYFLTYVPASDAMPIAALSLNYIRELQSPKAIIADIEKEFLIWIRKYPVPLMCTAVNNKGDGVDLSCSKSDRFLWGYWDEKTQEPKMMWNTSEVEFPEELKSLEHRKRCYNSIPLVDWSSVKQREIEIRRTARFGWWFVFFWWVIVPVTLAILGFFNIFLVGLLALLYSFYKGGRKTLEMLGYIKKSERQKRKEAEDLEMKHHHHHCKLNPDGFIRLRNENFEKTERESITKESDQLLKEMAEPVAGGDATRWRS